MEFKRYFILIILSALLSMLWIKVEAQKVRKVVIDAGHGGHDPGAVGKLHKEKDIALSIALKTGKLIEDNIPGVEVIYTRKTDVFVELYRRAKIANEAKADLFISIHCNANKSSTPYGSETYVMGLHKSDANLAVAQTENSSILLENDYKVKYDGFDPTSPEGYIFFSMLQNAYLDQSLGLASAVQKQFQERANLFDRGVKQAGFLVLYKTTMPSVLIEVGFISNPKEEKVLASDEGQNYISSAIFRAVKDYKKSIEKGSSGAKDEYETDDSPRLLVQSGDKVDITPTLNTTETHRANSNGGMRNITATSNSKPSEQSVVFKVQFMVAKTLMKDSNPAFKGLKNVEHYVHNGMYKYTYGNENSQEEANKLVKELNKLGFKDCFVVAFSGDKRIDIEEAKRMLMK